MEKSQNVDVGLLEEAIVESGLRPGFLASSLGISRQAFDRKRKGKTCFRKSEIYVLCDLLRITDNTRKAKIFYPEC